MLGTDAEAAGDPVAAQAMISRTMAAQLLSLKMDREVCP